MTMVDGTAARPATYSAIAAAFPSLSIATGSPNRSHMSVRKSTCQRDVDGTDESRRCAGRSATEARSRARRPARREATRPRRPGPSRSSAWEPIGVGVSRWRSTRPSRSTTPARIFVPPTSTPITGALTRGGYHNPPHARRGEAVPRLPRRPPEREGAAPDATGARVGARPEAGRLGYRGPGRSRSGGNVGAAGRSPASSGVFLLLVVWTVASYFSVRGGVTAANERLPRARAGARTPGRLMLSTPTDILLLGTDHAQPAGRTRRTAPTRSCSSASTRPPPDRLPLDPARPRVEIPGYGDTKINAAMQIGGPRARGPDDAGAHRPADQPRRRRRLHRSSRR